MNAEQTPPRVVVARSKEGNNELIGKLDKLGIHAVGVETIAFREPADWTEVDEAVKGIDEYDWVAFTSPRAVGAFLSRLSNLGLAIAHPRPRIAAVGSKTATELEKAGLTVDFVPKRFLTSELAKGLPAAPGSHVLLLRADIGDKALSAVMEKRGIKVTDLAIYQTVSVVGTVDPWKLKGAALVVFASPSEVRGFKGRVPQEFFASMSEEATAVCIGPVTAKEAKAVGFRAVETSSEHTVDALGEKVEEVVRRA